MTCSRFMSQCRIESTGRRQGRQKVDPQSHRVGSREAASSADTHWERPRQKPTESLDLAHSSASVFSHSPRTSSEPGTGGVQGQEGAAGHRPAAAAVAVAGRLQAAAASSSSAAATALSMLSGPGARESQERAIVAGSVGGVLAGAPRTACKRRISEDGTLMNQPRGHETLHKTAAGPCAAAAARTAGPLRVNPSLHAAAREHGCLLAHPAAACSCPRRREGYG